MASRQEFTYQELEAGFKNLLDDFGHIVLLVMWDEERLSGELVLSDYINTIVRLSNAARRMQLRTKDQDRKYEVYILDMQITRFAATVARIFSVTVQRIAPNFMPGAGWQDRLGQYIPESAINYRTMPPAAQLTVTTRPPMMSNMSNVPIDLTAPTTSISEGGIRTQNVGGQSQRQTQMPQTRPISEVSNVEQSPSQRQRQNEPLIDVLSRSNPSTENLLSTQQRRFYF